MTPFYRRLPDVPGFTVEATVDKIGLGLMAVTAAGVAAHAVGSVVRKRTTSGGDESWAAPEEEEEGADK
jgi:hydrogenase small subunit